jgi:hypothetical protein
MHLNYLKSMKISYKRKNIHKMAGNAMKRNLGWDMLQILQNFQIS